MYLLYRLGSQNSLLSLNYFFPNNWLGGCFFYYLLSEFFLNYRLFLHLLYNWTTSLLMNNLLCWFMNYWLMDLMQHFLILCMYNRLMNLSYFFLMNNWLVMLMNYWLMVLMNNVLMVFMNHVLVMLMNYISMVLIYNCLFLVSLNSGCFSVCFDYSLSSMSFEDRLSFVSDDSGCLFIWSLNERLENFGLDWCLLD